jgi:hypothetical protein
MWRCVVRLKNGSLNHTAMKTPACKVHKPGKQEVEMACVATKTGVFECTKFHVFFGQV